MTASAHPAFLRTSLEMDSPLITGGMTKERGCPKRHEACFNSCRSKGSDFMALTETIPCTRYQPFQDRGQHMKQDNVERLKVKICGKTIVSVEPSRWSGEVKSLMKNQEFLSITLSDGTVLEVGGLYIRDGSHT